MTRADDTALISAAAPRRTLARCRPAPMVLEQRIMFDGAGGDVAVRHLVEHAAAEAQAVETHHVAAVAPPAAAAPRTEVVFIEDDVNKVAQLVAGVRAGVEVIMLDHTRDGLQQMVDALAGHAPVDAIHVVSHGATGQLTLGTLTLSVDNVEAESIQLAQLGRALKAGGDLMLYGCDVAEGTTGAGFVDRVAALTGADVAASTDVTGSAAFGGNWTLEAHSGAIDTKALDLSSAGWDGELVNTVFDANRQTLTFDGTTATFISGTTGTATGNVTRFNDVITIGGQKIDAVVTTTLDRATMLEFDSTTNPSTTTPGYFQPTMQVSAAGGGVSFKIDFYLGGTYTGAGTGTAVTLQNVVVNSYDIDSNSTTASDRQFQVFSGFDNYTLSTNTQLVAKVLADGSVEFVYQTDSPVNNLPETNDPYRVEVYYQSMSSFTVRSGVEAASTGTFNGKAYFALDFSEGPAWASATKTTGTPAPNLSYSTTTFTEAADNDGSITATATITLANGTFSGSDNAALSGVSFTHLPAGLTASVTRTSSTTATLSFSGHALANASANDVANFGVTFASAAFTSNNAGAVTSASRADLVIDFADPDTTAPVVTARSDSYTENQHAGAVVSTVTATDAAGVTGFRFAQTGTATSADGYFAIAANGAISLTAAGAAAGAPSNDFETSPHSFAMGVQARDAAGNWSAAQTVTLNVLNVDDTAPLFSSSATANANENQAVLYTAAATDNADFTNHVVTYSLATGGDAALLHIDSASGIVTLASGALDYETRNAYSFTVQAKDATGNVRTQAVAVAVNDLDEIVPTLTIASDKPALKAGDTATLTFTFSEDVGASFTAADITLQSGSIGTLTQVDATHYSAVYTPDAAMAGGTATIAIASGRVQDLAGNANAVGASLALAVDTVAPTVSGATSISVPENTTAVHQFTASETVTWSIAGGEDAGRFTLAADGTLAFASAPDFEHPADGATAGSNTYLVNLRALDAAGNATLQAVTVTVLNANETPAGADAAFHVQEDTRHDGKLPVAVDPDGDTLTYAVATNGTHGQAIINADGTFSYQGAANYQGADSFTYTVSDGHGDQAQYTVGVTVDAVNDAPVAANAAIVTDEDTTARGALPQATDVDGDTVAYAKGSDPLHGTVTIANGSYVYTPAANFNGADSFTYTVSDGQGGANTYTVAITVHPVNDAPVASPASTGTGTVGSAIAPLMVGAFTDIDSTSISYSATRADGSPLPVWLAFDPATRTFSGTPPAGADGTVALMVSGSDGALATTTSVTLTIRPAATPEATITPGELAPAPATTAQVQEIAGRAADDAGAAAATILHPVSVNEAVAPAAPPAVAPATGFAPMADVGAATASVHADAAAPGGVASNDMSAFSTRTQQAAPTLADLRQAAELSDVYTRVEGFRTVVAKADDPALVLFQGVPDQFIDTGNRLALTVPSDAFAHTQPKAIVSLAATQQDGSALPSWVHFSSETGQFTGEPPAGLHTELRIKLTAHDNEGRQATALFRVNVGQAKNVPGKTGLSEQLRQSSAPRAVGARG